MSIRTCILFIVNTWNARYTRKGFNPLSRRFITHFKDMGVASPHSKRNLARGARALRSACRHPRRAYGQFLMPDTSVKNVQLIGSVLERTPGSTSPSFKSPAPKTGFPPVQHRSKSAFARSRDLSKQPTPNDNRPSQPPTVTSEDPRALSALSPSTPDESKWREDVSRENEKIVANMSPEERELERQAILKRFGPGIGAVLQRAKQNRVTKRNEQAGTESEREIEQVPGSPGKHFFGLRNSVGLHRLSSHATQ